MTLAALFLVRHAETTWNRERRMQGHADPPLTVEGMRQASELASRVDAQSFDALVSSDLQRALVTARAIAAATGLPLDAMPAWREHDMGAWTGLTREEIEQRWPEEYANYRAGSETLKPGGGESRQEFRARILSAKQGVEAHYAGKRVLVVTHRGAIRLLAPDAEPAHAELIKLS